MVKIKKIGIFSLGKIFFVLYAICGLIFGAIMTLFSLIGAALAGPRAGIFGILFGVGAIVVLPIVYGIMGFIVGLITAFLYNLVAKLVGGLELETE